MNALAVVARLVGCLFAVVLLVRIGLAFVAANPHNVIVEGIVRFSDVIVLEFRDLFLPSDPRIELAVNYGLAAVFWLAAGLIAGWALSWAAMLPGATLPPPILKNLSGGGLYVRLEREMAVGAYVSLAVRLSTVFEGPALRLVARGNVIRVEPQTDGSYGTAIEFRRRRIL